MKLITPDQARSRKITRNGKDGWARQYFGTTRRVEPGPQAMVVENPEEGDRINPHFHDTDQFQVVVGGSGTLGAAQVGPVAFHYADAYTPYGPIISGAQGLSFFSFRPAAVGGIFYVPAARHLMPGLPGRNLVGSFDINQPLPADGEVVRETLILRQADGVEAIGLHLGRNACAPGLAPQDAGQYVLVCSGSIVFEGRLAPINSAGYVEAGEAAPLLQAGPDGACVLVMQFPRATERPGSDVSKMRDRDPESYVVVA